MYIQIFTESDVKYPVTVFRYIVIIGIKHFQIHIIARFIKQFHKTTNGIRMAFGKHSRYVLCNTKQRLFIS